MAERQAQWGLDPTLEAVKAHGWQVVLLARGEKRPAGSSWRITTDLDEIRAHYATAAGIGLVCGPDSSTMVLDFDNDVARAEMFRDLGELIPWSTSPSGGVLELPRFRRHPA